jgi:ubiquinone/menaquinone biosynthesis C-methylase UbiE
MHWSEKFFTDRYRRAGLEPKLVFGPMEAQAVKKALRLKKGASVLDLCCGIGRHSVALAALGMKVTGLDLNGSYLSRARSRARRAGVKVRFIKGDMRNLDFTAEFNAAISLFTSFGYYDDKTNLVILTKMVNALRPRGRLLLDVINRDTLVLNLREWNVEKVADGELLVRSEFIAQSSRIKARWRLVKGRRVEDMGGFDLRAYSLHELAAMMESAGMKVTDTFGSLALEPFQLSSNRLVISAVKKV